MLPGSPALKLLVVSDIHMSWQYLKALKTWISGREGMKFDYVLVPGDTDNVQYSEEEATHVEQQQAAEERMIQVLKFLEQFGCPVLYIPGNHDCLSQFRNKQLTSNSHCLHKQQHKLAEGLSIVGFGGSLPAYSEVEGRKVWEGYPYQSEQDFEKEWDPAKAPSQQHILMTHVGPHSSATSVDRMFRRYLSGSKTLDRHLEQNSKGLMLWIHGHTHNGVGQQQTNLTPILNPGSLSLGRFAIVQLVRKQEVWRVAETRLIDLNVI